MIENIMQKGEQVKGFYSPAKKIDLGNCYLIFVSGIQASKTDADIAGQTHEVFDVIGSILQNAGATFDDVVKAVIYVTDMKDFDVVSKIRADYFKNSKPASTLVEVSRIVNDNAKIEIELTAVLPKNKRKEVFGRFGQNKNSEQKPTWPWLNKEEFAKKFKNVQVLNVKNKEEK